MNDFCILLVEDEDKPRQQLTSYLKELFPTARIDSAATVGDGLELIQEAANRKTPYDIAILDFKLPKSQGENPEVDETLCLKIRDCTPTTIVGHITGFPDDPIIRSHVERIHPFTDPRGFFINKQNVRWPEELVENTRTYLYTFRLNAQIEELFGRTGSVAPPSGEYARFSGSSPNPSLTTRIAELCGEIGHCWKYLDGTSQSRIRAQFSVDESKDPPFVVLR